MNRKIKLGILGICLFWSAGGILPGQKADLSKKHKQWLQEEVIYIITPKEKEVFYKLENDRERDGFIEEFWRQRDPTPGTAQNEFKEEHYRRIEFANRKFGRETPTKGWRTDRGRIYIMLGRPSSVQRYESAFNHPIETWQYSKSPKYIRLSNFRLMFFKRHGFGDYELYHLLSDKPADLVTVRNTKPSQEALNSPLGADNVEALDILKNYVSEDIAAAALSVLPGAKPSTFSLSSIAVMGDIETYPQKKVDDDYAYEFLEHKTAVEVSYSVHYMGNQSLVNVLQDPSGLFFVNYAIVPETLSVDLYQDQYFTDLKASFRLSDFQGKTIFQGESMVPLRLKKEELKQIEKNSFQLYDAFPIIPGDYHFDLLLENLVTKEFTSLEKNLFVPAEGELHMTPVILAHNIKTDSPLTQSGRAFQLGRLRMYPSIDRTFLQDDSLFLFFQLFGLNERTREEGLLVFSFFTEGEVSHTLRKKLKDYASERDILEEFSLEKFLPGKCRVEVSFFDHTGDLRLWESADFAVITGTKPGFWTVAQTRPPLDDPSHFFALGTQYLNQGDFRNALEKLTAAHELKPDSLEYALGLARGLMEMKNWDQVKEILSPFTGENIDNYSLYYCLGKSSQETGRLPDAVEFYRKALNLKGSVVYVLNALGECHLALGDKQQALKAWTKSLEINPRQENIKKLIEKLKD